MIIFKKIKETLKKKVKPFKGPILVDPCPTPIQDIVDVGIALKGDVKNMLE